MQVRTPSWEGTVKRALVVGDGEDPVVQLLRDDLSLLPMEVTLLDCTRFPPFELRDDGLFSLARNVVDLPFDFVFNKCFPQLLAREHSYFSSDDERFARIQWFASVVA